MKQKLIQHCKATTGEATCISAGKESPCNVGDLGSIPGLGRSPGEGKGYPLQYSGLENSMDQSVGFTKSWTRLNDIDIENKYTNTKEGKGSMG